MQSSPGMLRLVVLAYRLGLSWLVGRRRLLITTGTGDAIHRTVVPFRWHSGVMLINTVDDARWVDDLRNNPVAMAQAAPGPLAVAAEFHTDGTISLPATGRPAPPPVAPDLLWLYPFIALALPVLRRQLRRH